MPIYNVRFDIADVRYIAFEKFCKKHNIEFSIQPLLQQTPVSGSLPLSDAEMEAEAELRYPVETHVTPNDSPK
jgi:hypothetical protein